MTTRIRHVGGTCRLINATLSFRFRRSGTSSKRRKASCARGRWWPVRASSRIVCFRDATGAVYYNDNIIIIIIRNIAEGTCALRSRSWCAAGAKKKGTKKNKINNNNKIGEKKKHKNKNKQTAGKNHLFAQ